MSDEFDEAFDRLVIGDTLPEKESGASVEAELPDEVPAEAQATSESETVVEDNGAGDEDRLFERLESLASKLNSQKTSDAPPEKPAQPQEEVPQLYTKEEQALLNTYETDWPDVAAAEALKRRVEYQLLAEYIFRQVGQVYGGLLQDFERNKRTEQLGSEFAQVKDGVGAWIEQQPNYLQSAYKQVIQAGSAEDVADLVARYKRDTAKPAAKTATELPAPTMQAVAALAPVSSKRSVVPAEEDKNDFDAAFARFANS